MGRLATYGMFPQGGSRMAAPGKHACAELGKDVHMQAHLEQQLDAVKGSGGCARHCACCSARHKHPAAREAHRVRVARPTAGYPAGASCPSWHQQAGSSVPARTWSCPTACSWCPREAVPAVAAAAWLLPCSLLQPPPRRQRCWRRRRAAGGVDWPSRAAPAAGGLLGSARGMMGVGGPADAATAGATGCWGPQVALGRQAVAEQTV